MMYVIGCYRSKRIEQGLDKLKGGRDNLHLNLSTKTCDGLMNEKMMGKIVGGRDGLMNGWI